MREDVNHGRSDADQHVEPLDSPSCESFRDAIPALQSGQEEYFSVVTSSVLQSLNPGASRYWTIRCFLLRSFASPRSSLLKDTGDLTSGPVDSFASTLSITTDIPWVDATTSLKTSPRWTPACLRLRRFPWSSLPPTPRCRDRSLRLKSPQFPISWSSISPNITGLRSALLWVNFNACGVRFELLTGFGSSRETSCWSCFSFHREVHSVGLGARNRSQAK